MKHIVALYGTSNVGKSMTIKLLYQKLIDNYEKDILLDSVKQMKSFDGDIRVVITINGKVIGIESQGDPNSRIFESLPFFVELKCDIIILVKFLLEKIFWLWFCIIYGGLMLCLAVHCCHG